MSLSIRNRLKTGSLSRLIYFKHNGDIRPSGEEKTRYTHFTSNPPQQGIIDTRHDALGYVEVRFRVEEPVKGCSKVGAYVLREWAGRWVGRADRYRVGQRYLMMLTARGPLGMSAPVFGGDGAIPLGRSVAGPIAGTGGVPADVGGAADGLVDLGLLQARVLRSVVQSPVGDGNPVRIIAPIEVVTDDLPVQAPLATVLQLLRGMAGNYIVAR